MIRERNVIAVDLDGTLAYDVGHAHDPEVIGDPVPEMKARVLRWIEEGTEVQILTSRLTGEHANTPEKRARMYDVIQDWCERNGLPRLRVTATKEWYFREYWDDRSVQVVTDTGHPVVGPTGRAAEPT